MRIDGLRCALGACSLAALAIAAQAWAGGNGDVQGGPGHQESSPGGAGRATFHRFTVPWTISEVEVFFSISAETVVKVVNDSDSAIDVTVEWHTSFDGSLRGTSGPVTIEPHEENLLSTLNAGESAAPFFQSTGFRDTTADLSGTAKVFVGPNTGSAKNVTVTAFLLTDLDKGQVGGFGSNARTVTALHVNRADDDDGDGIVDTRFKGD